MNKFEFISHLLENQKMNLVQKERFLKLASKELGLVKPSNEELWLEIETIKRQIGFESNTSERIYMTGADFLDEIDEVDNNDDIKQLEPEMITIPGPDGNLVEIKVPDDFNRFNIEDFIDSDTLEDLGYANSNENINVGFNPLLRKYHTSLDTEKNNQKSVKQAENENSKNLGTLEEISTTGSEIRYATHKNLPSFLRRLNANDYTKFLTHSVDSTDISKLKILLNCDNYNFELHLKKIKEVFDILTERDSVYKENFPELQSYFLPKGIYTKIKQYIYGKTWSLENNIKMYWSHPSIKEWVVDNFGKSPSANEESLNYEGFYFHSTAFNKQMSFSDLILFFKNEIHIRNTNSLYNLINNIYNNPDDSFKESMKIENNVSHNLDFYTDVEKLRAAIKLILELIFEKHSIDTEPRVIFNIAVGEEEITLSILHLGNRFEQNIETLRYGKSFYNLIDLLNGVCGLEVVARFSDSNTYRLRLWEYGDILRENTIYRNNKPLNLNGKLNPIKDDINGVQYNLTFNRGL